jgi:hypothetical protein
MKLSISCFLLVFFLSAFPLCSDDINEVRYKLIRVTGEILKIEHEMLLLDHQELEALRSETGALTDFFNQLQIGNLMQNIRHVQSASPLLMAMAMDSSDDLVQSIILLQSIAKQMEEKNKVLIERIKKIGTKHLDVKKKVELNTEQREKIRLLSIEQENLLNEKYNLFFKTSSNPNLEKFADEQSKMGKDALQGFDDLIHQLQTLFNTKSTKSNTKLKLIIPVNGFFKEPQQSTDEKQDLAVNFDTSSDAQVISPLEGSVVFASFVPSFGHVVILKQDEFFCVIIGMGSIHCFLGDTLLVGEPIGRMPLESEESKRFQLRFELHKGSQNLDPRPYFSM